MSFFSTHEIKALPTSSPESQIKYLMAVVRIKEQEISSLKLELDALRLNRQADVLALERQLCALESVRQTFLTQKSPPLAKKKRSWKFWRRQ